MICGGEPDTWEGCEGSDGKDELWGYCRKCACWTEFFDDVPLPEWAQNAPEEG
jgi:hypothetical protein